MEDLLFVVTIWLIGLATPIIGIASLKIFRIILQRNDGLDFKLPNIGRNKEEKPNKVCKICGKPGHYSKTCPENNKQ